MRFPAMKALLTQAALVLGLAAGAPLTHAARLVIWMVGDDKTPQVMQPAVAAFRAAHPDVAVEVRDVPWADAMTKYSAALASRRGPDLVTGSTSYAIALGAKGALIDLNEAAPDLARQLEQHANPGALRAIRRQDGRLYGAPFDMHVQLQYYRSDLAPRAPPTGRASSPPPASCAPRATALRSSGATRAGWASTPICARPAVRSTTRLARARSSIARRPCAR
jgi:multiple sugar transport system substrate-binding protein